MIQRGACTSHACLAHTYSRIHGPHPIPCIHSMCTYTHMHVHACTQHDTHAQTHTQEGAYTLCLGAALHDLADKGHTQALSLCDTLAVRWLKELEEATQTLQQNLVRILIVYPFIFNFSTSILSLTICTITLSTFLFSAGDTITLGASLSPRDFPRIPTNQNHYWRAFWLHTDAVSSGGSDIQESSKYIHRRGCGKHCIVAVDANSRPSVRILQQP